MNTLIFSLDRVVSMDEIDDYFKTRGRWNGERFELASTPAKKLAFCRSIAATWLMRTGWAALAVLAAPPVSIAFVWAISAISSTFPSYFPDWVRSIVSQHGRSADKITVPSLPFLFVPLICWGTALLLRRRSSRIWIEHEDAWDTDRISFVEPLMADGLLGSPEALLYLDDSEHEPEPFCVPLLTLAEELPTGSDPNEHHLIRAAAQCLLIESACRTPVDTGVLRFRNRSVSFVMTDFARKRTREMLAEIRRLHTSA